MTKNILVVEDDPSQTRLSTEHFKDLGPLTDGSIPTVVFAKTLASATDILSKMVFDLIYLDGNLSGSGLKEVPDTLELFKLLAPKHRHSIFTITDSIQYQHIFEEYGCTHVRKTDVAQHAHAFLSKPPLTYTIGVGKLLVIQLPVSLQVYVAKVIQVSPLVVCAHDTQVPLTALTEDLFAILQDESALIQGAPAQQQHVLNHYARFMRPIEIQVAEARKELNLPAPVQKSNT